MSSLPTLALKPPNKIFILYLGNFSNACCKIFNFYVQLVPYDAVNRNKVSIRQLPLFFIFPSYSLHVSAPTGHPQVRYTIRCFQGLFLLLLLLLLLFLCIELIFDAERRQVKTSILEHCLHCLLLA
jgi:hypothetical protein